MSRLPDSNNPKKILVIDDDTDLLQILKDFLGQHSFDVTIAPNGRKGIKALDASTSLVLCDIKLPDFNGLEILSKIKKLQPSVPVVMITGYSDVSTAVESLRRGAADYVTKPLYPDEILLKIKELTIASKAANNVGVDKKKSAKQVKANSGTTSLNEEYVVGESAIMTTLNKNLELVAPTDMGVLILGETGSGKEFVAKRLHQLSKRSQKQFVSLDCGALPQELAASEIFGHKKGSFTGAVSDKIGHFELADGGTLFLDEVGNLSYENQVKLLRVLQERKVKKIGGTKEKAVDFRLIVATNDDLSIKVKEGEFREDLFYRLNEFNLQLPPIRKRGNDILLFANHFLNQANLQLNKNIKGFKDDVESQFLNYSWPGNLRELRNIVKRATLLCSAEKISKNEIPMDMMIDKKVNVSDDYHGLDLKTVSERAEKAAIIQALKKHQFNKTLVAKALKVDRKTLYNKINAYGIE